MEVDTTTVETGVESEATRFVIDDEGKANWYLRELRMVETEIATVKSQAAEMIRALEIDANRLRWRHEADFLAWAKEELGRRGGTRKTLPLFQGTVAFRTVPMSLRIAGSGEAIEYARSQGWDVIRTVECLDSEGYRRQAAALLTETGEVLPGIEIVPERESFSVRFGKDNKNPMAAQEGGDDN